ncbi:MAG: DNA polymerase I [Clostridia bacterium]|nr:DNA polymerase I [Clostridia bacterium]
MKYLLVDGNSLINRAFYGIKLLSAKDGHFTNAIYGFFNIILGLDEKYAPDSIIVAFDVHHPTFRHNMYAEYKAGRKSPPSELIEQFEPAKKLIEAYGCKIVECPGYEADDIIGTLSAAVSSDDFCYIVTGDRDSLQLIRDNVSVLLVSTKMGKTQTVEYDKKQLWEDYGVSPEGMIEIKALQGDSSDNIPGVQGIGPKTAGELIKKYGTIDTVYENIDSIEVTAGVRNKLMAGKESAFFSRQLGTICLEAPIERNMSAYCSDTKNTDVLLRELTKHEMFKIISRLHLDDEREKALKREDTDEAPLAAFNIEYADSDKLFDKLSVRSRLYLCFEYSDRSIISAVIYTDSDIFIIENNNLIFNSIMKRLLESEAEKFTDDCKKLYYYCYDNGIEPLNIIFDINLAAYLLDANSSDYSVQSLALSYNIKSVSLSPSNKITEEYISGNKDFIERASLIKPLSDRLFSIITEREQTELLKSIEIPLSAVLVSMENVGMKVDVKGIEDFSEDLQLRINDMEQAIYSLAGEVFNINSPKQLGVILFEKLGLPSKKKTKTGYSTSADVLEALADEYEIVSLILSYRTFAKLKSTYCDGLLKAVHNDSRVRSTFNQTETRTGRLSSTEPNLQNIPVRTPLGREMRKFFIAEDGYEIIDADYSQIELRVLAALSGDKNMTDAFNSGVDIHSVTASKVFGIDISDVTSELRSKAKAVNFGIVYGIGAFSLAKDIKSTRAEADSFIKSYLSLYSSVSSYMDNCIAFAKKYGYSVTHFNRRRYLPELSSSNGMLRAFGERVARNMPIQGTAADIIKIAMINVHKRLKKEYPEARLIMQVHDELMAEAPSKDANAVAEIIKEEMENSVRMAVKFTADTAVGRSWYDAKD